MDGHFTEDTDTNKHEKYSSLALESASYNYKGTSSRVYHWLQ